MSPEVKVAELPKFKLRKKKKLKEEIITEITKNFKQLTDILKYKIHKYKLQKYINTYYRYTSYISAEIQITVIQITFYRYINYRNTEF